MYATVCTVSPTPMPSSKTGQVTPSWNMANSPEIIMTQEQLTKFLTLSENIQESIQIAGELWELSDFEVTALCGIVADAFAEKGITMEALI